MYIGRSSWVVLTKSCPEFLSGCRFPRGNVCFVLKPCTQTHPETDNHCLSTSTQEMRKCMYMYVCIHIIIRYPISSCIKWQLQICTHCSVTTTDKLWTITCIEHHSAQKKELEKKKEDTVTQTHKCTTTPFPHAQQPQWLRPTASLA